MGGGGRIYIQQRTPVPAHKGLLHVPPLVCGVLYGKNCWRNLPSDARKLFFGALVSPVSPQSASPYATAHVASRIFVSEERRNSARRAGSFSDPRAMSLIEPPPAPPPEIMMPAGRGPRRPSDFRCLSI